MKKFTLLLTFFVAAYAASAQFVIVNSPGSIAGAKAFSAAGFGADLNSGIWTADAELVDDGSANPSQGCGDLINGAAIAGKIALVDRGTCEFGLKCLNAEMAGAIAVVVFNNAPGAGSIVMGAGAVGINVTIPCVMLSYEDGQIIRNELALGPVNITIGAFKFPNDLGTRRSDVMNAPVGVIPTVQAEASDYLLSPAAIITNKGENNAVNVKLTATVQHSATPGGAGSQVYNQTGTLSTLLTNASETIELPTFTPTQGKGVYSVQYVIASDSTENPLTLADNEFNTRFVLSDNVFCKGGWDFDNNRPANTNAYTISGGGNIQFMSGFHMPKGVGYRLDSVQFYVSAGTANLNTLPEGSVSAIVYLWYDLNGDNGVDSDELIAVGFAPVELANLEVTNAFIKVPILEYPSLDKEGYVLDEDDIRVFVGVRYEGPGSVFLGFDENYDQTLYSDNLATSDLDLPYLGANVWDGLIPTSYFLFTGFRGSASAALIVGQETSSTQDKAVLAANVRFLPNPANDFLTVETALEKSAAVIEYTIRDAAGRQVLFMKKDVNGTFDRTQFNVSQFASGQYYMTLQTANGSMTKKFVVQH